MIINLCYIPGSFGLFYLVLCDGQGLLVIFFFFFCGFLTVRLPDERSNDKFWKLKRHCPFWAVVSCGSWSSVTVGLDFEYIDSIL